jgi:hypothetical protein
MVENISSKDLKFIRSVSAVHGTAALSFVSQSAADLSGRAVEGSAVQRTFPGNVFHLFLQHLEIEGCGLHAVQLGNLLQGCFQC